LSRPGIERQANTTVRVLRSGEFVRSSPDRLPKGGAPRLHSRYVALGGDSGTSVAKRRRFSMGRICWVCDGGMDVRIYLHIRVRAISSVTRMTDKKSTRSECSVGGGLASRYGHVVPDASSSVASTRSQRESGHQGILPAHSCGRGQGPRRNLVAPPVTRTARIYILCRLSQAVPAVDLTKSCCLVGFAPHALQQILLVDILIHHPRWTKGAYLNSMDRFWGLVSHVAGMKMFLGQ
jgi:hypothetical protein